MRQKKGEVRCPFLKTGQFCVHNSLATNNSHQKPLCPYVRNRKRCLIWVESPTKIKSPLEPLKIDIEDKEE